MRIPRTFRGAALLLFAAAAQAGTIVNSTWVGGVSNDWLIGGNWSPATMPDNFTDPNHNTFNVTINSGAVSLAFPVNVNHQIQVDSLIVSSVASLTIANTTAGGLDVGRDTLSNPTFINQATINVDTGGRLAYDDWATGTGGIQNTGTINVAGELEFTGSFANNSVIQMNSAGGVINMKGGFLSFFYGNGPFGHTGTLVNSGTFEGWGDATGPGNPFSITNHGLVDANSAGNTLQFFTGYGLNEAANNGTMQASGGGILMLRGDSTDLIGYGMNNAGGTIQALDGSTVVLQDALIQGGTLRTFGTGQIIAGGNAGGALTGMTLNGTLNVGAGTALGLAGSLTVASGGINVAQGGTLYVSGAGFPSTFALHGAGVNTPAITLNGGTIANNNPFFGTILNLDNKSALEVDANSTIQGVAVLNFGKITVADGKTLTLDNTSPNVGTPSFQNFGTLKIGTGSTLELKGTSLGDGAPCATGTGSSYCVNLGTAILGANSTIKLNGQNAAFGLSGTLTPSGALNFTGTTGTERLVSSTNALFGTLNVSNMTWDSHDFLTVASGGNVTIGAGATYFQNGSLTVQAGGNVTVNGTFGSYNPLTKTLGGNTYNIGGTFTANNFDVRTTDANITVTGNGQFFNPATNNGALALWDRNNGNFTFDQGAHLLGSATTFTTAGTLTLDHASSLTLPFLTSFSITSDPNNQNRQGVLQVLNGSTFSTGATSFQITNNNPSASNPLLLVSNAQVTLSGSGIDLNNGNISVQNGGVLTLNGQLTSNVGNSLVQVGGASATDHSMLRAKGADFGGVMTIASGATADFTGGTFANLDANGVLKYGNFNVDGTLLFDSPSANGITGIAAGAQLIVGSGSTVSGGLSALSQVDGTFGLNSGASLTTSSPLSVGTNGQLVIAGNMVATGLDNHGSLVIYGGASGYFVGSELGGLDANGTLNYGSYNIQGQFDYSGSPITTIGANASFTVYAGAQVLHHSSPAPAFEHLTENDGQLFLFGYDVTTDQAFTNKGSMYIGSTFTSNGFYQDDPNALLTLTGTLDAGAGGVHLGAGQYSLFGQVIGDITSSGDLTLHGVNGNVTNEQGGTLSTVGTVNGDINNAGLYNPGGDPGATTVNNYSQTSTGTMLMEIEGVEQGSTYDWLNVLGNAHLDGTLKVTFPNGNSEFTCDIDFNCYSFQFDQPGFAFNLISWATWDGSHFANYDLPSLDPGLVWTEIYGANGFTLEVDQQTQSQTPEPGSCLLLGCGLVAVVAWRRRR
ncbi:MAG TPA: hypothetical protein VN736_20405 [Candidatus Limnocylindrales bacterium]|nr:hypothetical protein [Candidatus Limnocylindrales bacterium]